MVDEWVFESVWQFMKCPLWSTPVDGFIDEHCIKFDRNEPENKLEYTALHNEFRKLVDELLSHFLEELGVPITDFVEGCKQQLKAAQQHGGVDHHRELKVQVLELIFALDDFVAFRAMMEKRNVALELEALMEDGGGVGHHSVGSFNEEDYEDEEEMMLAMAIRASLAETTAVKSMEKEDAELLHALALSVAMETERKEMERMAEQDPERLQQLEANSQHMIDQLNEEYLRERMANLEMQPQAPVLTDPSQPAVQRVTQPQVASPEKPKAMERALAPVAEKRSVGSFTHSAPLPGISGAGGAGLAQQPTFVEMQAKLKQQQQQQQQQQQAASGQQQEPQQQQPQMSEEEVAKRAAYLRAQRDKLQARKQAERQADLSEYLKKMGKAPEAPVAEPAQQQQQQQHGEDDADKQAQREMRVALARRFREDLVEETRRAAARDQQRA